MNKDLIIALLALAFAGAAAALLVTLAKLQEEKGRRWDEISLRLSVENELEQSKEREKRTAEATQWYADQLAGCEWRRRRANNKNREIQDRLSALLCPRNDHIWVDGVCKRCGRAQPLSEQSLPELFVITDYGASGDPGPRGVED